MIAPASSNTPDLEDLDPAVYFLSLHHDGDVNDTRYIRALHPDFYSCSDFSDQHSFLHHHHHHPKLLQRKASRDSPPAVHYIHHPDSAVVEPPSLPAESFHIAVDHLASRRLAEREAALRSLTGRPPCRKVRPSVGYANMATTAPPSSPPELSSSMSSTQSSPSSVDEQYDPSNFEDISLAEDGRDITTVTPSPSRAPKPRPLVRPALRTKSSPRPGLTSPDVPNQRRESSPRNTHSRPSIPSSASPSSRGALHRGHSTPILNSSAGPRPLPLHVGSRNRFAPPATKANPFPFAPQTPVSPNPQAVSPTGFRSFENSPVSPLSTAPRRGSWQRSNRKSAQELEDECHDSDEDLPEDAIVWNVPLTPRRMDSRSQSNSPERQDKKDRLPPQPQTGSLEKRPKQKPPRSKSWTEAMWELSDEAKALTQALESHAETVRAGSSDSPLRPSLKHSKTMTLPPVRRTDALIDPFPPSKEKEKFLTRTRPSWLPPKCKKEEKKHLKEWEKMMADFVASEKRKSTASDTTDSKTAVSNTEAEAATAQV